MAEHKADDIKQLFSHLGLNPNDYQEIRTAPRVSSTVTESSRRWSLLQAIHQTPMRVAQISAKQRIALPHASLSEVLAPPAALPVSSSVSPPLDQTIQVPLPTLLEYARPFDWDAPSAAKVLDKHVAVTRQPVTPVIAPVTPVVERITAKPVTAKPDSLKSLFQSVLVPAPAPIEEFPSVSLPQPLGEARWSQVAQQAVSAVVPVPAAPSAPSGLKSLFSRLNGEPVSPPQGVTHHASPSDAEKKPPTQRQLEGVFKRISGQNIQ